MHPIRARISVTCSSVYLYEVLDSSRGKYTTYKCHMHELELCLRRTTVGYIINGAPYNAVEIAQKCKNSEETRRCFWDYNQRCAPGSAGELLYGIFGGYKDGYEEFCSEDTTMYQAFVRQAVCVNKLFLSDEFTKVLQLIPNGLQAILWNPEHFVSKLICGTGQFFYHLQKGLSDNCHRGADIVNQKVQYSFSNFPFVYYEQYVSNGTNFCSEWVQALGDSIPDSEDTDDFLYFASKFIDMRKKLHLQEELYKTNY